MPRPHKPRPGASFSYGGQGSSSTVGQEPIHKSACPDVDLDRRQDMPTFRQVKMPVHMYTLVFTSYWWFNIDGRLLCQEEFEAIVSILYGGPAENGDSYRYLYPKLEDPTAKATIKLNELKDQEKENLTLLVGSQFIELLKNSHIANERNQSLRGFKGRLTAFPWGQRKRPILDGVDLRDEQIYLIYAIVNWCKDSKGRNLDADDTVTIVYDHFDYSRVKEPMNRVLKNLTDQNHWVTAMVAERIVEVRHRTFFEGKAHTLHKDYSGQGKLRYPAQDYPPVTYTATQSDPIQVTTAELSAMTVAAPAPNPKSPEPFADYLVDYDSWEPAEDPRETSGDDPRDKGKRGQVDSSSESPEGEGSGKGKEAARKKQRA